MKEFTCKIDYFHNWQFIKYERTSHVKEKIALLQRLTECKRSSLSWSSEWKVLESTLGVERDSNIGSRRSWHFEKCPQTVTLLSLSEMRTDMGWTMSGRAAQRTLHAIAITAAEPLLTAWRVWKEAPSIIQASACVYRVNSPSLGRYPTSLRTLSAVCEDWNAVSVWLM